MCVVNYFEPNCDLGARVIGLFNTNVCNPACICGLRQQPMHLEIRKFLHAVQSLHTLGWCAASDQVKEGLHTYTVCNASKYILGIIV